MRLIIGLALLAIMGSAGAETKQLKGKGHFHVATGEYVPYDVTLTADFGTENQVGISIAASWTDPESGDCLTDTQEFTESFKDGDFLEIIVNDQVTGYGACDVLGESRRCKFNYTNANGDKVVVFAYYDAALNTLYRSGTVEINGVPTPWTEILSGE